MQRLANQILDRCRSTNDVAKDLAEAGYPHGTWISSRVQDSGRGRLGRKWESIEGNLFLSVIARIENQSLWSWVPLTAGVAMVQSLRRKFSNLDFRVKWPNDIWVNGSKLGGILCEGAGNRSQGYIVIGMGLNCVDAPQGPGINATDLSTASGGILTPADQVRMEVIHSLIEHLEILVSQGPERIAEAYSKWAMFPTGVEISWGTPPQKGFVEGLGPSGELKVLTPTGSEMSLFAEDVSLTRIASGGFLA